MRLVGPAGEDGGCPPFRLSLGGEEEGAAALSLARVVACDDEPRFMGVGRGEIPTDVGGAGGDDSSLAMKSSRACVPPAMERKWRGP